MLIRCHGGTRVEHKEERGRGGKLHFVEVEVEVADAFVLGQRIYMSFDIYLYGTLPAI